MWTCSTCLCADFLINSCIYFKEIAKPAVAKTKGSEVSVKKGAAALSKKKDSSDSESSDEDDSSSDEEPVSIIYLV